MIVTWELLLTSTVLVAGFGVLQALITKWRSRGEKQAQTFTEMGAVVEAYKQIAETHRVLADKANDSLRQITVELDEAKDEVVLLRVKVVSLEMALDSAHNTIKEMMQLVRSMESSS